MLPTIKLQLSTYFYATIQYIMSFQMGGTWSVLLFGWSKRWDALLFPFICVRSVLYTEAVLGCIFVFKTSTKGFTSVYSDSLNKVIWILLKIEFFYSNILAQKGKNRLFFLTCVCTAKGYGRVQWKPLVSRFGDVNFPISFDGWNLSDFFGRINHLKPKWKRFEKVTHFGDAWFSQDSKDITSHTD